MKTGASKFIFSTKTGVCRTIYLATLKAGAVYEHKYLLGSFARPLIAKCLVEIATQEGPQPSATEPLAGNDKIRFELSIKALNPDLKLLLRGASQDIRSRKKLLTMRRPAAFRTGS